MQWPILSSYFSALNSKLVSHFFIVFLFSILTLAKIQLFLNISLMTPTVLLGFLLAIYLFCKVLYSQLDSKEYLSTIVTAVGLLLFSFVVQAQFFDLLVDGMNYQMGAVIAYSDGYNPIYQHFDRVVAFYHKLRM